VDRTLLDIRATNWSDVCTKYAIMSRRFPEKKPPGITPSGFVMTGSNQGGTTGVVVCCPSGTAETNRAAYFGAVPPLPVVVAAGMLPRRTSRRS
jgi:hypothetical protein